MKYLSILFTFIAILISGSIMANPPIPIVTEGEELNKIPANSFHTIITADIDGYLYEKESGKYCLYVDDTRQLTFIPPTKENPYTGEPYPFNLEEFAKNPDFTYCKIVDFFVWTESPNPRKLYNSLYRIFGKDGKVVAFENTNGQTFLLKRYYVEDLVGRVIVGLGNRTDDHPIGVNNISAVLDCSLSSDDFSMEKTLDWNPQTRTVMFPDSSGGYICDKDYNPGYELWYIPSSSGDKSKLFPLNPYDLHPPVSYDETDKVLTFNYRNGDYCKFSKLKDYELFECILHLPFGVLTVNVTPEGGIERKFDCTGEITTSLGKKKSTYIGFTNYFSGKMILNPPGEFTHGTKFDDIRELQDILDNNDYSWRLTSTGERAVWEDGKLITQSLKEKRKQDEIAANEKIRKEVIASYKAKYGATVINNIMNGRITVGMPWALVSSVFPNGLYNSSSHGKIYKVINNIPQINISSKKIVKQEYGLGNLVYVTVRNGKVSNVTYTNHR